jgi:hypothetical protein
MAMCGEHHQRMVIRKATQWRAIVDEDRRYGFAVAL